MPLNPNNLPVTDVLIFNPIKKLVETSVLGFIMKSQTGWPSGVGHHL